MYIYIYIHVYICLTWTLSVICVTVSCIVSRWFAVCCSAPQNVAVCCSVLQCVAMYYSRCVAVWCSKMQLCCNAHCTWYRVWRGGRALRQRWPYKTDAPPARHTRALQGALLDISKTYIYVYLYIYIYVYIYIYIYTYISVHLVGCSDAHLHKHQNNHCKQKEPWARASDDFITQQFKHHSIK